MASADVMVLLSRGPFNIVRDATSNAMFAGCECRNCEEAKVEGSLPCQLDVEARFLGEAGKASVAPRLVTFIILTTNTTKSQKLKITAS